MNGSNLEATINSLIEEAGEKQALEVFSKQVSVRLSTEDVFQLDRVADSLGESRTGLATSLLHAAIRDAGRLIKVSTPWELGDIDPSNVDEVVRLKAEYDDLYHAWLEKNGFKVSKEGNATRYEVSQ